MATTTNFGWETPDDTDLVKDGAAAIRTALGGVDTSFVDLKGGTTGQVLAKASATDLDFSWVTDATGISATIFDAKGDIIAATAADTASRLAVGANDTVLTADSTAATGLKWAAPASGGMTLISTTTVSGSSITLSSIPQTYNTLYLVMRNIYGSSAGANFSLRFNGVSTGSTYDNIPFYSTTVNGSFSDNKVRVITNQANTSSQACVAVEIPNYTNTTTWKSATVTGIQNDSTDSNWRVPTTTGFSNATSAVTSLVIYAESGTFTAGTVLLYGVK